VCISGVAFSGVTISGGQLVGELFQAFGIQLNGQRAKEVKREGVECVANV